MRPAPIPQVKTSNLTSVMEDIRAVSCHICTIGFLCHEDSSKGDLGDLLLDFGSRLLNDLELCSELINQKNTNDVLS